jgi:hypothetical protein
MSFDIPFEDVTAAQRQALAFRDGYIMRQTTENMEDETMATNPEGTIGVSYKQRDTFLADPDDPTKPGRAEWLHPSSGGGKTGRLSGAGTKVEPATEGTP